MKKYLYPFFLFLLMASCSSQKNSEDFMTTVQGRYLFNANEVIEIYFKEQILYAKWRGNDNIKLLKVNDSAFYMKELNEKMIFVSKPDVHIKLAEKTEHKGLKHRFRKISSNEKTPSEHFKAKEFEKALQAYKAIKETDSLSPIITQRNLNRLGYKYVKNNNFDTALEVFKMNATLYPKSSKVFNSLGEGYVLKKDTINAIANFKKSLSINPENRNSIRFLKKITKK